MTEPVGCLAKDGFAARCLGVDGPVGVAVVAEAVALAGGLERLLTDLAWGTAVDVGREGGEDRGLHVEIDLGVAPVVGGHHDVEGVLCVEGARAEILNAFDRRVVDVERREVSHGVIVEFLLVPCVV